MLGLMIPFIYLLLAMSAVTETCPLPLALYFLSSPPYSAVISKLCNFPGPRKSLNKSSCSHEVGEVAHYSFFKTKTGQEERPKTKQIKSQAKPTDNTKTLPPSATENKTPEASQNRTSHPCRRSWGGRAASRSSKGPSARHVLSRPLEILAQTERRGTDRADSPGGK